MKTIKNIYLALKFSFSYFSNIPVSIRDNENINNKTTLSFSIYFLPIVGFVLSTISVILFSFFEGSLYFAIVFSIIYMILYGFIHTEAIADVIDAVYAKHSNIDPYKVIKEPTIGAMGLLYTSAFLILKVSTLTYMLLNKLYLEFIVISMISRSTIIYLIPFYEFRSTFIEVIKKHMDTWFVVLFLAVYLLFGIFLLNIDMIYLTVISIILTLFIVKKLKNILGFINGDVLGFNIELTELILMIFCIVKLTSF